MVFAQGLSLLAGGAAARSQPPTTLPADAPAAQIAASLENAYVKYVIGADGRNRHFIDKRTGIDYCDGRSGAAVAHVKIGQREYDASAATRDGDGIRLEFGEAGVTAVLKPTVHDHYLVLEVRSLDAPGVAVFTFVDVPLTLKGRPDEPFAACALALNLKTNVHELPQPSPRLRAMCYPRFGFGGAAVALIGCPPGELREVMKEVVRGAPELPQSALGGPWALEAKINKGSYLFNFGNLSEQTVDDWIKLARRLGITQIDFHGGGSFRFGDCRPNPQTYPRGLASLKAVIDRLHEAGIAAGLHTYSFFVAKDSPWVTPVPDPRLGKDATFTLAAPLTAEASTVPVVETTQDRSTITGFFVRNSLTLQIDEELIVYTGVSKEAPFAFTGCQRGAHGTKAAPHDAGARVHHLKQCFFLFTPDGDSTLLTEVAAKTAETYNECGFDMIYMDALDGEGILGGDENGWYYGSKFVFEVCRRLKKPAVMEMSTFHHHLWVVRSRMGAWDHPNVSHKKFIDIHCQANEELRRMFLPGHLGWWAVKTWSGIQGAPTFPDDIEYLCAKCLGHDVGFSVMGIDPANIGATPVYERLGRIMKQYEDLRHAGTFDDSIRSALREPGREFTLFQQADGRWRFRPVRYAKHKVQGINGWSNHWSADNPFGPQPLKLRIEALMSAGPYEAEGNVTLADFTGGSDFPDRGSAPGVTVELQPASQPVKASAVSGRLAAANTGQTDRRAAWARASRTFDPPLNLAQHPALGVWVHGDGQGEVLNVQLRSPDHLTRGIGEHYVIVDFTGWRYFELIEPDAQRYSDYAWPYGDIYSIYREPVDYAHVETLGLWYNNLSPGKTVTCHLSPVRGLPVLKVRLRNPAITVAGRTIVFPVEMESGTYLEFQSRSDCRLYGPSGEVLTEVKPQGDVPLLRAGANDVSFTCDGPTDVNPRGHVTLICQGDPI